MTHESDKDRSLDELAAEIGELVDEAAAMSADVAHQVGGEEGPGDGIREAEFFKSQADSENSLNAQFLQTDIAMHATRQELGLDPRGQAPADAADTAPSSAAPTPPPETSPAAPGSSAAASPAVAPAETTEEPLPPASPAAPAAAPSKKKLTKLALPPRKKAGPAAAGEQPPAHGAAASKSPPRRKPRRRVSDRARPAGPVAAPEARRLFGIPFSAIRDRLPMKLFHRCRRMGRQFYGDCLEIVIRVLEAIDRKTPWAGPRLRQVCGVLALTMLAASVFLFLFGVL